LIESILKNHKTTKIKGFGWEMYLLNKTKNEIAVIGRFGAGAPVAVSTLEELVALGIKSFISIGMAGSLQKNIKLGDLVVCEKAIRDEGTSHHYLKPSKYAYASKKITEEIKKSLNNFGIKYTTGVNWTIDAPYRETVAEVKKYQTEGVSTVEMESSALFAAAQYRMVELGTIFVISDSLAELKWQPGFHFKKIRIKLENLFEVAVGVLLKNNEKKN
jgi:uridine phosphorylase